MSNNQHQHIDAFDAMRFIDCEMTATESSAFERHLAECLACREFLSQMRERLRELPGIVSSAGRPISGHDEARMLLKARLANAEDRQKAGWFSGVLRRTPYALRYATPVLIGVLFLGGIGYSHRVHKSVLQTAVLLPNNKLTPGAVRAVNLSELCAVSDDDDLDPAVSVPTQMQVFYEYGIPTQESKKNFQVDYLINPQLGGSNDVRNLWPQPYDGDEWNARAKDALERYLHQMVCEKRIELADAQRDIAYNWIDAYKKYFHTSKPI